MSNHFSKEQFARCFIGRPTAAELQHISECPQCSAELDRFGVTISLFRTALRDRIDDQIVLGTTEVSTFAAQHETKRIPKWRWALAAAAVVALVMVPTFTREKESPAVIEKTSTETDPNALMDAVNLHLLRTIPAPMERMMTVIPNDESIAQPGGVQ